MAKAIQEGKFREDLYYRLSTIEIGVPPLRTRKEDIHLLFRKFASDFGQKYKMPTIRLQDDAIQLLTKYRWPGNIRQLRNVAEQISVLESERNISLATLNGYLPHANDSNLPAVIGRGKKENDFSNEREILYKVLFDMKADLNDLKKLTLKMLAGKGSEEIHKSQDKLIKKLYSEEELEQVQTPSKEESQEPREVELLPSHEELEEETIFIDEPHYSTKDKYD